MKSVFSWLLALLCVLSTLSCDQRADALKAKAAATASALSAELAAIKESQRTFIAEAEKVYAHLDEYDLSTNKLDVKDGGVFQTFQDNKYYYKTVDEGASFYASPLKPVDNALRKEVRTMQLLEPFLLPSYERKPDLLNMAFYGIHEPTVAILYPRADIVSFLPPGLDARYFEWYRRGLESSGEALWAPSPFVSLYTGWVTDLSAPVKLGGRNRGVMVMTVGLARVEAKYFKNEKDNLLLLGGDLTLVIANAPARAALDLKVIEDVDYTKQMNETKFAPEAYRLSDPSQTPEIQALASKVSSGERSFNLALQGKTWHFAVEPVSEAGFFVVGFVSQ